MWRICGYISTYAVDRKRERVHYGASTDYLNYRHSQRIAAGQLSGVRFLWQHQQPNIIGWPEVIEERPEGIWVEAVFIKDDDFPDARRAYKLAKWGLITDFSIGYIVLKESAGKDQYGPVRELLLLDIQEFSLVTIPMNPEANVYAVKALELETGEVEDMEEVKALRDEVTAMRQSLDALVVGLAQSSKGGELLMKEQEAAPALSEDRVREILAECLAAQVGKESASTLDEKIAEAVEEQTVAALVEAELPAEQVTEALELVLQEASADSMVENAAYHEEDQAMGSCPHCGEFIKMCKPAGSKAADEVVETPVEDQVETKEVEVETKEDIDVFKGILGNLLELKSIICEGQS